jgi:hypothetical protein
MATCEVCGNDYDKAIQVSRGDEAHVFDSFECAIEAMAPRCARCEIRIIGHGVETGGAIFCCAHCAAEAGQAASPIAPDSVEGLPDSRRSRADELAECSTWHVGSPRAIRPCPSSTGP